MKVYILRFAILIIALILCACVPAYKQPLETEPHSLLKIKYSYDSVLPSGTLRVRATVREGDKIPKRAFQIDPIYGQEVPLQVILIRPGINTEIGTWLGFWWETPVSYITCDKYTCYTSFYTVYNEKGCKHLANFVPEEGKIYILDYNNPNVDSGCDSTIYEQVFESDHKFKLKPVGIKITHQD